MSNVLIGIIGVILFIGLALAGALFLGPRFQEVTADSKAAALVQQAAQVAQARSMYRVQEGREPTDFAETGLIPGYLKAKPINPTNVDYNYNAVDVDGQWAGPSGAGKAAYLVIAGIGGDTATAAKICASVSRQSGLPVAGPQEITAFTQISRETACIKPTAQIGVVAPGNIYIVARV
jgi:hypothetical protein